MSVTRQRGPSSQSGSGAPPLNRKDKQSRDGSVTLPAPTGRKTIAQGKERSDAALGHESQNTSSPEGAKERVWPVVFLGEIAEVKLGKMLDKAKHQAGQRLPYLRNVNVRWGTIETDDLLEMHFEEDELDRFGLKANDVLVCEGGEPGRASVWNGHLSDLKFQKALHRVRFKVPFDPRLLVYLLELLAKNGGLERRFTGSTIKHFTREAFVQLPVPLPPLEEQRRIVEEIEKQFTRLEAGVSALRRVQANLKRYRAAVLKAACEGKLVPTEHELSKAKGRSKKDETTSSFLIPPSSFESGEALLRRILEERRKYWTGGGKYKEPAAPDTANLPPIPEGWAWATVAQLSTRVVDGTHHTPEYISDGVAFISVKDIRGGIIYFDDCKFISPEAHAELSKRCDAERDDVLITKSGTIGRMAVVNTDRPFSLFVSVALIKPVRGIFDSKFLKLSLEGYIGSIDISQDVKGALLKNLHLEDLRVVALRLPPLAEQTRIVAEVERRLSVVEELESVVNANLQRATRLRQCILQKAFTGNL